MRRLYRTDFAGESWMHRCPACGFCLVSPMPAGTCTVYEDAYTSGAGAERKNRRLAPDYFAKIRVHLPPQPFHFLEAGGSHGWLAQRVRDECGAEVLLLEPGRSAVASAHARGLAADCGFIETFTTTKPFDVLCAAHVIEHVVDAAAFLGGCHGALRAGGTLILLTPNAGAWKFTHFGRAWAWAVPDGHTLLLSAEAARHLLARNGFEVVSIRACTAGLPHYPYFFARWLAEHRVPRVVRLPLVAAERVALWLADAIAGETRADELLVVARRT